MGGGGGGGATPICGPYKYVPPISYGLLGSRTLNRVSFLPLLAL